MWIIYYYGKLMTFNCQLQFYAPSTRDATQMLALYDNILDDKKCISKKKYTLSQIENNRKTIYDCQSQRASIYPRIIF